MKSLLFLSLSVITSISVFAGETPWIPLWEKDAPGPSPLTKEDVQLDKGEHITRISTPSLQIWLPKEKSKTPRPALCVFPGGGYNVLAIRKEGQRVAQWAAENGMVGIVVKYRVSNTKEDRLAFPVPLVDGRRAIRMVHDNASTWNIDPAKIGVIGFSAGGHLAAMTATIWDKSIEGEGVDSVDKISCRPDFAMLIYPVISLDKPYGHGGSARALLRDDKGELVNLCTPYKNVSKETPPLFLIHATDDRVSCLNSLDMVRAAKENNVSVEFHLYATGDHGFGMYKQNKVIDSWTDRAVEWLKTMKILEEKK